MLDYETKAVKFLGIVTVIILVYIFYTIAM
jgi:hypothetical protein